MSKWSLWAVALTVLLAFGLARTEVVVAEGEGFKTLDNKGWKVTHQDDSYASHTYGGMWTSNGGLLGAPADSVGSVAATTVTIPAAGQYRVWSKYQSMPYYNFMHKIEIVQNGNTVLSRVYGKLDTPRLYSFSGAYGYKPFAQLFWIWGVDHDAAEGSEPIALAAGPAEIRLTTVRNAKPAGDPMVDFILLTTEAGDTFDGYSPFRTSSPFARETFAAGKLYLRFRNTTAVPAQMILRVSGHMQPDYGSYTSTYPVAPVQPGEWSPWFNVAPAMKLVHEEGAWLTIAGATEFPVQVAREAEGKDLVGDMTVRNGEAVVVPVDIAWNKTRRVITSREHAASIIKLCNTSWRTANGGNKPKEILYFGRFIGDAQWVGDLKDALGYNTEFGDWPGKTYDHNPIDRVGYTYNLQAIQDFAAKLTPRERAGVRLLSFGDEIHVADVSFTDPAMQPLFVQWLKAKKVTKADLGVEPEQALLADYDKNTRIAWYAKLFSEEQGYKQYQQMTAAAKELLGPQVETGANYSPHIPPQYYGPLGQYIDLFKANGMSMYWTEDYIFSVPQQPQMISWLFAMQNCAVKYNKQMLHTYIMPHAPGQLPSFLRRNMVYAVGAGARHIDNFWVAPAETFTENYIAWAHPEQFKVLHESIFDSAEAEPYQLDGKPRPNPVAIVLSRATDFNERQEKPDFAKDKFLKLCDNAPGVTINQNICHVDQQMLYLALKQAQLGVDLITEEDINDGCLKNYEVIYFAGEWVDHRIVPLLETWVRNGGVLYATAGLGHLNEFKEDYTGMLNLLGLRSVTVEKNAYHLRPYLEMPLADPIDTITLNGAKISAIGMKQVLQPAAGTKVLGTWSNGKPTVTIRAMGKGKAFAVGTLAGTSFMKTGLRQVPFARGGQKMIYNPTGYNPMAATLALLGAYAKPLSREVICTNTYVEALVLDSDKGTLLTLVNWDNKPLPGLTVSIRMPAEPKFIRSVQGQQNLPGAKYENGVLTFTTDLEWADYLILGR